MKYLRKHKKSEVIHKAWRYPAHSKLIRLALLREQVNYCAYSERFADPLDSIEVEHFDERLKEKSGDSYWNWYAVCRMMNQIKMVKSIDDHLPILQPYDPSVHNRIKYEDGQFQTTAPGDVSAQNLIDYLGLNDPTLADSRQRHIQRQRQDREDLFPGDDDGFVEYLVKYPSNLSYITALVAELKLTGILEVHLKDLPTPETPGNTS